MLFRVLVVHSIKNNLRPWADHLLCGPGVTNCSDILPIRRTTWTEIEEHYVEIIAIVSSTSPIGQQVICSEEQVII